MIRPVPPWTRSGNSSYLVPGQFAIVAHRGGSLEAPENTLEAFAAAADLYSQMYFELDVHPTKDGKIVVIHDDSVDRTTSGHGQIEEMTWDEIRELDAGYHWSADGGKTFPFRGSGVRIPLLEEVLSKFPQNRVSIELKPGHGFFGDKVVEVVKKGSAESRVCLAGEDHRSLAQVCSLNPDLCSGYSGRELYITFVLGKFYLPNWGPNRGAVMQIPYSHNGELIATKNFVSRAHKKNKFVHVWTVNVEETMRHLIGIGVDGIITDAPTRLLKVARDLKKI